MGICMSVHHFEPRYFKGLLQIWPPAPLLTAATGNVVELSSDEHIKTVLAAGEPGCNKLKPRQSQC